MKNKEFYESLKHIIKDRKYDNFPELYDYFKLVNKDNKEELKYKKKITKNNLKLLKNDGVYSAFKDRKVDARYAFQLNCNNLENYTILEKLTATLTRCPYVDGYENYLKYDEYCRKYDKYTSMITNKVIIDYFHYSAFEKEQEKKLIADLENYNEINNKWVVDAINQDIDNKKKVKRR